CMRINREYADEVYDEYNEVFSYPPRVGREGLGDVLEIIARQSGKPQVEFKIDRFLDESLLDELAAEVFLNNWKRETSKNPICLGRNAEKSRCDHSRQRFLRKTNDRDFSLAFSVEENKRINQSRVNKKEV